MTWRKVVVASVVAVCGTIGLLYWFLNRPVPIVPPTAALYDGRYETGGYYQVTRFNDDGRHRIVVNLGSAVGEGKPGVYPIKLSYMNVLTSQYDTPLQRMGPSRGPIDSLERLLRRFQSRNKVAQWISESGEANVTVHSPPGANGRYSISVELKDVVLRKEGSKKPPTPDPARVDPDLCKIDSLLLGPVEFGK